MFKSKKSRIILAAVAVLAMVGGGLVWFSSRARVTFKRALQQVEERLPPGASLSYKGVRTVAFRGTAGVREVFYDSAKLSMTATTAHVANLSQDGDTFTAPVIVFDDVVLNLKEKGVKYRVKRAVANGSNLADVTRSLRRATASEIGRLVEARDITLTDVTSTGKGMPLVADQIIATDVAKGTAGTLTIKGAAVGESGEGRSIHACSGANVPLDSIGDWAAATITRDREATLVGEITAVCK
jgi:hypothetical protein